MRWPKYWSFSFRISPSSEHAGLISFRMDWLDLLAEYTLLKNRRITRITSIGINNVQGSGLQMLFSRSAVSDSLQLHGLQHSRLLCPSLSPRVCSNLCPLSWWCYPTILSSVTPFSNPQFSPTSGSFPMSQPFASDGQSTRVSVSAYIWVVIKYTEINLICLNTCSMFWGWLIEYIKSFVFISIFYSLAFVYRCLLLLEMW